LNVWESRRGGNDDSNGSVKGEEKGGVRRKRSRQQE